MVYPFTIGRGAHFCKLWGLPLPGMMYNKNRMVYFGKIENGQYVHGDADQMDWNKMPGFSANGINHKFCSQRPGWRWNLDKHQYEFQPYVHDNGSRVFNPPGTESFFVGDSQAFVIDLQDQYSQWEMRIALCKHNDLETLTRKDVDFDSLITWHTDKIPTTNLVRIALYPYFGGQKRSVGKISLPVRFMVADSDLLDTLSDREPTQQ